MANKPIQYSLVERTLYQGEGKDRKKVAMQVAYPTGRHRVDFRAFCERVGKATTFTHQEVAAVLGYATEIAKDIVANGDIVDFGDLGTLSPSFKSRAIPMGEEFDANVDIVKPVVRLRPNARYFHLSGVSYERVEPKPKKDDKPKGEDTAGGSKPSGTDGATDEHVGI